MEYSGARRHLENGGTQPRKRARHYRKRRRAALSASNEKSLMKYQSPSRRTGIGQVEPRGGSKRVAGPLGGHRQNRERSEFGEGRFQRRRVSRLAQPGIFCPAFRAGRASGAARVTRGFMQATASCRGSFPIRSGQRTTAERAGDHDRCHHRHDVPVDAHQVCERVTPQQQIQSTASIDARPVINR
jgi:hypothetical protein